MNYINFDEDSNLSFTANAFDIENDDLTFSISSGVNIISSGSNGEYVFTALENWNGTENFSVSVTDGSLTDTQILEVSVNPINDSPVTIDSEQIIHEGEIAIFDLLGLTTDVDQTDTFTFTLVDDAANGECVIVDGTLTYTPNENYPNIDQLPGINTCTFHVSSLSSFTVCNHV